MAYTPTNPFTDIEPVAQDLGERLRSRMLIQFQNSPCFNLLLNAFAEELIELYDAQLAVIRMRAPFAAVGENLNVLGRIVGEEKTFFQSKDINWFKPDGTGSGPDQKVIIWVLNAPKHGDEKASDEEYRGLIKSRVMHNMAMTGSVPEIQQALYEAFKIKIGIFRSGPMQVDLLVDTTNTPEKYQAYLVTEVYKDYVTNAYRPPYPATLGISGLWGFVGNYATVAKTDQDGFGADGPVTDGKVSAVVVADTVNREVDYCSASVNYVLT